MQFEKQVEINAPREKVWKFIWDIDRFIACVPGCKDAKTVEDDRYKFTEYVSDDAKEYLADRYGYKEYLPKPAAAVTNA